MGIFLSKCYNKHYETPMQLKSRIQFLEGEITRLKLSRERESKDYEEKEKAWRRERRKYKEDEVEARKKMKEDEERIRCLEVEKNECKNWQSWLGTEYLVEHMKEEQAQREVAVEKWKQLYLTIKTELDDLIHRTAQGGRFGFGGEEGLIDRLQTELMAKEETVEALRSRLLLMETEGVKREREIDILRQSLRILSNTKRNGLRRNLHRRWLLRNISK